MASSWRSRRSRPTPAVVPRQRLSRKPSQPHPAIRRPPSRNHPPAGTRRPFAPLQSRGVRPNLHRGPKRPRASPGWRSNACCLRVRAQRDPLRRQALCPQHLHRSRRLLQPPLRRRARPELSRPRHRPRSRPAAPRPSPRLLPRPRRFRRRFRVRRRRHRRLIHQLQRKPTRPNRRRLLPAMNRPPPRRLGKSPPRRRKSRNGRRSS